MSINHKQFGEFIKFGSSQKEVSLIVAKDDNQLEEFKNILNNYHFNPASNCVELVKAIEKPVKIYFIALGKFDKNYYDFIVQYPTGLVEIFDKNSMQSKTVRPYYATSSVIFLTTQDELDKIQKNKFDILATVGLTYRSK